MSGAHCCEVSPVAGGAGVTRPDRPGIDVDAEPPAVRMNDMLGGILTYKLEVWFLSVQLWRSGWMSARIMYQDASHPGPCTLMAVLS